MRVFAFRLNTGAETRPVSFSVPVKGGVDMSRLFVAVVSVLCLVLVVVSPCAAQWVWQNPLPQGNDLQDIWGSSWSDVFAVGNNGTILHGDGWEWSSMDSGVSERLLGVWGTAGNDVFTVGAKGTILHYDGTSWSAMDSGTLEWLEDVWGTADNDVYAVGFGGTILHFNGSTWSPMVSGISDDLNGIWGSLSSDIFAVGSHGLDSGVILHFDGTSWSSMASHIPCLVGVWGTSGDDVFAVGPNGAILHYTIPQFLPTVLKPAMSPVGAAQPLDAGDPSVATL